MRSDLDFHIVLKCGGTLNLYLHIHSTFRNKGFAISTNTTKCFEIIHASTQCVVHVHVIKSSV